jgi:hypothetical protein
MALSPNPLMLSSESFTGIVTNSSFDNSLPPWSVLAVKASSGQYLEKARWSFTPSDTAGVLRNATLTLAPGSTDEEARLRNGEQLTIVVRYANTLKFDCLYVRL